VGTGVRSRWLNHHQPISLAVNGNLHLGREVWERSGVVVFTAGTLDAPALSCQARPQDGECFGELPPRSELTAHTRFPMLVPTPTPAYNASYTHAFLEQAAEMPLPPPLSYLAPILHTMSDASARGYCVELLHYLFDACHGPWEGRGARACLYGLQRPPLGRQTLLRLRPTASEGDCWPFILPFLATTARCQLEVSIAHGAPARATLEKWLGPTGVGRSTVKVVVEDEGDFEARRAAAGNLYFNVLELPCARAQAGGGALVPQLQPWPAQARLDGGKGGGAAAPLEYPLAGKAGPHLPPSAARSWVVLLLSSMCSDWLMVHTDGMSVQRTL